MIEYLYVRYNIPIIQRSQFVMNYILSDYSPKSLYRYFEDICAIPHGSGNEKQIADYVCAFAEKNGLEYYRDTFNNVLIKKNASEGYAPFGCGSH